MNTALVLPLLMALSAISFSVTAEIHALLPAPSEPELIQASDATDNHSIALTGIGRLQSTRNSYCSASLIDTRSDITHTDMSPAYIITSQRCFNTDSTDNYAYFGGVQSDIPTTGKIHFNNFSNSIGQTKTYTLKNIAWQSDAGLDLSIIELNEPLSQLIADGIKPLKIARETPPTGTAITTLGIPTYSHLSATQCTQLPAVDIASYPWVSARLLPNKCADLTLGGRGGPVLNKTSNELISLVVASTHGMDSHNKCLHLTPCELKGGLSHWEPDTHYTLPVSFLNQCFTRGKFSTDAAGCELDNAPSVWLSQEQHPPARILEAPSVDAAHEHNRLKFSFSTKSPLYRYKHTHNASECLSVDNYSAHMDAQKPEINISLGNTTGMHFICLFGVPSKDHLLATHHLKAAKIIATERFSPAQQPTAKIKVGRESKNSDRYHVSFEHTSPFFEHFTYKYGSYSSTDCSSPTDYKPILPINFDGNNLTYQTDPNTPGILFPGDLSVPPLRKNNGPWFGQTITLKVIAKEQAIKVCSISHNRERVPMAAQTYILNPL